MAKLSKIRQRVELEKEDNMNLAILSTKLAKGVITLEELDRIEDIYLKYDLNYSVSHPMEIFDR